MSIGLVGGIASGAAGAPLAQTRGTDVERAQQEASAAALHAAGQQKAETAAGIGEADGQEHQTAERDADGRLPWNIRPPEAAAAKPGEPPPPPVPAKDPSGTSGNLLDLTG
jgi:hypothetical protein